MALTFAHFWLADLLNTEGWYVSVSWAAFLILTLAFHIGLALVAVMAVGVWLRMWRAAALLAVLLGATLGPSVVALFPSEPPMPAPGEDSLLLMSANLMYGRCDLGALTRQVLREDPDVVVLQEYTPAAARAMVAALSDRYPHRVEHIRDDAFGQAVFSRRPFASPARLFPPGDGWREPQALVTVALGAGHVAIMNIHLLPPSSFDWVREHRVQAARLAEQVAMDFAEHGAVVLAGDFNATPESPHLRALVRVGFAAAHEEAGRGRASTWPRTSWLRHVPGIRLDHALGAGVEFIESRTGEDFGSDHRPVLARFVLGDRASRGQAPAQP